MSFSLQRKTEKTTDIGRKKNMALPQKQIEIKDVENFQNIYKPFSTIHVRNEITYIFLLFILRLIIFFNSVKNNSRLEND